MSLHKEIPFAVMAGLVPAIHCRSPNGADVIKSSKRDAQPLATPAAIVLEKASGEPLWPGQARP